MYSAEFMKVEVLSLIAMLSVPIFFGLQREEGIVGVGI
jgi:hypothetical protein